MTNYPLLPLLASRTYEYFFSVGKKTSAVCSVTNQHFAVSQCWKEAVTEHSPFAIRKKKFWYSRLQTKLGIQPGWQLIDKVTKGIDNICIEIISQRLLVVLLSRQQLRTRLGKEHLLLEFYTAAGKRGKSVCVCVCVFALLCFDKLALVAQRHSAPSAHLSGNISTMKHSFRALLSTNSKQFLNIEWFGPHMFKLIGICYLNQFNFIPLPLSIITSYK